MRESAFAQGSLEPKATKQTGGGKRLLLGCGIVVFMLAAVAGGIAVWVFNRYEHANQQFKQARPQYQANDKANPFQTPAPGVTIPAADWKRMLTVRAATLGAIDKDGMQMLARVVKEGKMPTLEAVELPRIAERVIEANLAALRENRMALEEYLFLTGVLVTNTLKQTSNPAPAYREAMNGLVQALRSESDAQPEGESQFDPEHFQQQLDQDYGAWTIDQPEVYATLAAQDRNEALGDVLLALFAPMILDTVQNEPAGHEAKP